jgi:hypothetical protein
MNTKTKPYNIVKNPADLTTRRLRRIVKEAGTVTGFRVQTEKGVASIEKMEFLATRKIEMPHSAPAEASAVLMFDIFPNGKKMNAVVHLDVDTGDKLIHLESRALSGVALRNRVKKMVKKAKLPKSEARMAIGFLDELRVA